MRTKRRSGTLLALGCAAALAACSGPPVRSVVLASDQAELVAEQCSRPNPPHYESTWQPGPEITKQLELDLPALKAVAPAHTEAPVADVNAYDRQYFGIVVHDKRLIYINAFQPAMANKDWKYYAIVVCDTTTGAWGALYDPASRGFSDFAFNLSP